MPEKEKEFSLTIVKMSISSKMTPWDITNTRYIELKPE